MKEYLKFGFGFYFGYEIAKQLNKTAGEIYTIFKERIEKGC